MLKSIENVFKNGQEVIQANANTSININDFKAIAHNNTKISRNKSAISVVCHRNSHRVILSKDLLKQIGNPKTVQVAISSDSILIAKDIGLSLNDEELELSYTLKGDGNIIYSTELVDDITSNYNLDFTNTSSITFTKYKIGILNGIQVAIINIK